MDSQDPREVREQLQMQIDEIMTRPSPSPPPMQCPPPPPPRPAPPMFEEDEPADPESFGQWLLAQRDRGDWIDELANSARRDPAFPANGRPDDVRARLEQYGAEGDVFEQLDDAERCWRSQ